jgi:hypothetical protein
MLAVANGEQVGYTQLCTTTTHPRPASSTVHTRPPPGEEGGAHGVGVARGAGTVEGEKIEVRAGRKEGDGGRIAES